MAVRVILTVSVSRHDPPPRPSRETLIRRLEVALDASRDDEEKAGWLNITLTAVEGAIQTWRSANPHVGALSLLAGRPTVVEGDAQTLLDMRAVNPGSDCRREFERSTGVDKQQARIRYQNADALRRRAKSLVDVFVWEAVLNMN